MNKSIFIAALAATVCLPAMAQTGNSTIFIDKANMDMAVKPGDNFYLYANGAWLRDNPVPASKTRWGSFNILAEQSLERVKNICEMAAANPQKSSVYSRVGNFYKSAMDSAGIEARGMQPIAGDLAAINAINSKDEVLQTIARLRKEGIASTMFAFRIDQDDKNVNKYIVNLGQGGTTLPDRDYYLKPGKRNETIRAAYLSYVADMFVLTGMDTAQASATARGIMALETALAQAQMSRVEMRDPQKTYNKFGVAQLGTETNMNWTQMLQRLGIARTDSVLVNNPGFFKALSGLIQTTPLDTWKNYLQWNILKSNAGYLSSPFVNRQFAFTQVLTGQKEIAPRWQRMSGLTDGRLGDLMGQLYVQQYFDQAAKNRMNALVKNVQETFAGRIQRLDWMSAATKKEALVKLRTITNKIGFPDKWETYEGVQIRPDDLVGNLRSVGRWAYRDNISKLGKPVDKTEWGMTPPTVNAYYNPSNNEIAFPAGILAFPFFDFKADDAVNYGGIAAVIGHELTHGFDDQGRQYAADGNLKNWWQKVDEERFTEKADKVVEQYNAYTVNDTVHVNGKLTLGENLADLGGINIAYEAFKKTPQGKANTSTDGFTADQRFFLSWAQVWRANQTPEAAAQQVVVDPHSPGMYRCNGPVAQMDAWYNAFNVQPGEKMYIAPTERIKIW